MRLHSSLWVIVCGRSACDLADACGGWREKKYGSSLGDNSVNYNVLNLYLVLLCIYISSGWGVSIPGGTACRFYLHVFLTLSVVV